MPALIFRLLDLNKKIGSILFCLRMVEVKNQKFISVAKTLKPAKLMR
jgi:hypothetical protein